jgi:hypothetical protein
MLPIVAALTATRHRRARAKGAALAVSAPTRGGHIQIAIVAGRAARTIAHVESASPSVSFDLLENKYDI